MVKVDVKSRPPAAKGYALGTHVRECSVPSFLLARHITLLGPFRSLAKRTPPRQHSRGTKECCRGNRKVFYDAFFKKRPAGGIFSLGASGGEVCHLESKLRMHSAPRASGQITSAFGSWEIRELNSSLISKEYPAYAGPGITIGQPFGEYN